MTEVADLPNITSRVVVRLEHPCDGCAMTPSSVRPTRVGSDDGSLALTHTFTMGTGSATLTVNVSPDEHPPEADHDLGSTEACDDPKGHKLDASHSLSSDPDSDIALEFWWVDGIPRPHGHVLPPGAHEVALEVRDDRGATDATQTQWVYVTSSCPS